MTNHSPNKMFNYVCCAHRTSLSLHLLCMPLRVIFEQKAQRQAGRLTLRYRAKRSLAHLAG